MQLILNADVHAPEPLGRQHLLIAAGRVVWMGQDRPVLPDGMLSETVDLAGRALLPGFIDGHAHLTGGGGEAGFASRVPPPALSRYTAAGATTVVGLLGTDDVVRDTGSLVGQARALCEEGITAYCYTGGYHLPVRTLTGSVSSDIVHIDRIIGCGELAISDHRSSQPTADELARVASECHVAGLMTGKAGVLHLHLGDGERGLGLVRELLERTELPARTFNPTHINRRRGLLEEAVDLAGRGSWVDVTAYPEGHDPTPDDAGVDAVTAVMRYLEAGGPAERVTVSSDGGGCLPSFGDDGRIAGYGVGDPGALPRCLSGLLAAGMELGAALAPFTRNPAELLRLDRKGRIAVGADADLVVWDEGVSGVMAGGRWHRRDGRQIEYGTFEGVDE